MGIQVLVADEHEVIRVGVRCYLARTQFEVIEATSAEEALRIVQRARPDVVLMEIRMSKGLDGLAVLRRMRRKHPDLAVLILSSYHYPTYVARARALGAAGYLSKACGSDEMRTALRKAAAGEDAWTPRMLAPLHDKLVPQPTAEAQKYYLTPREREVLTQLAYGLPNRDIAQALGVSIETIKEHVGNIRRKVGVAGRVQAAVWALRNGLA